MQSLAIFKGLSTASFQIYFRPFQTNNGQFLLQMGKHEELSI